MADMDSLPPDQRAAVSLLVRQGQSYEQLAGLLQIDASAVRSRAHAALASLGPVAGAPSGDARARVSDYLLGQQSVAERELTRDLLARDARARAWARTVAGVLRPLAPDAIPEIPIEQAPGPDPFGRDDALAPYAATPPEAARSSRLGGALLLGGLALIIAVVVVFVVGRGGGDEGPPSTNPSTQTRQAPPPNQPIAQINLLPPGGGTRPVGLAQVFRRGSEFAIILAAQGLPAGTYALWLHNSAEDARLLGFVPNRVGRDGRFATQGVLPRGAERYRQLVVTKETVRRGERRPPSRPGKIVLQGRLQLQ